MPSSEKDDYGIPRHFESGRIQVRGLVTATYHDDYHHWNASQTLGAWLGSENVPGLYGVDCSVPLLVNTESAVLFAHAIQQYRLEDLQVLAWDDYVPATDAMAE